MIDEAGRRSQAYCAESDGVAAISGPRATAQRQVEAIDRGLCAWDWSRRPRASSAPPCLLRVNRAGLAVSELCLLCSALRTSVGRDAKSEKGHEQKSPKSMRETPT